MSMGFFERLFSGAISALEFHLLRFSRQWIAALVLVFVITVVSICSFLAPSGVSRERIVVIPQGASLGAVTRELAAAQVIAHPTALQILLRISGGDTSVQSGAYRFSAPEGLLTIMHRLTVGAYDLPPVRVTFSEGMTVRDMAMRTAAALPEVRAADFLSAGTPDEGYLFPDTYLFQPSTDVSSILKTMRANFDKKTAPLFGDIAASGHSLSDIVIMASLLEKEARTSSVRRMIAGILWNRIQRGMPLQVDAVFGYIFGRDTYAPSLNDLSVDSPYNTYTHKGLPPGPINNPGLDALEAAANPTKTNYLYYLTDKDGVMHYATTYAGHQANLRKYLK